MRDSEVPLRVMDGESRVDLEAAAQIREHLSQAQAIAARHGFASLVPFLEVAGHGLDEIERMKRPVPRVRIVRN